MSLIKEWNTLSVLKYKSMESSIKNGEWYIYRNKSSRWLKLRSLDEIRDIALEFFTWRQYLNLWNDLHEIIKGEDMDQYH